MRTWNPEGTFAVMVLQCAFVTLQARASEILHGSLVKESWFKLGAGGRCETSWVGL